MCVQDVSFGGCRGRETRHAKRNTPPARGADGEADGFQDRKKMGAEGPKFKLCGKPPPLPYQPLPGPKVTSTRRFSDWGSVDSIAGRVEPKAWVVMLLAGTPRAVR